MAHGAGHHQSINALPPSRFTNASRPHRTTVCPWPIPTETCEEALAGPCAGPDLRARRGAGRTAFCDGESGAQEKRRRTRVGDDPYQCAPAAHRAGMRAVSKSISFCSRPARVRITAPALRASARRCSTLPARLRAARVVARACCCYGARSRASSEYKCAAAEQVHERKPTSSHHRMPRWPMPTETCQEALAGPCVGPDLRARRSAGRTAFCDGESGAQEKRRRTRVGDDPYQCAPAAHRAGMRAVSKSISFSSRPARVRITAPALRASARRCSKFDSTTARRARSRPCMLLLWRTEPGIIRI